MVVQEQLQLPLLFWKPQQVQQGTLHLLRGITCNDPRLPFLVVHLGEYKGSVCPAPILAGIEASDGPWPAAVEEEN